jgi:IS5 family transposase
LNFRHLLEQHNLGGQVLDTVNLYLANRGIRITTGTIVDAIILHAPSSTKNEKKERNPEMHQTKKGNQWYFGMKAHIGVDSKEGIVPSVCSTTASVSGVHMLPDLLHVDEKKVCNPTDEDLSVGTPVWGDAGYRGQTKAIHKAAPPAQDMTSKRGKPRRAWMKRRSARTARKLACEQKSSGPSAC